MSSDSLNPVTTNAKLTPVSAFVICYNEEEHIGPCLSSLSFCDEVLVIDSYSTDRTVEIATSLGATVVQRSWPGYREQKAFGLSKVKYDWVINIDADERLSQEAQNSIKEVLAKADIDLSDIQGYYLNRVVYYLGRWWRKGGWYPEYRLRFFRRDKVTWGGLEPHERPEVNGRTAKLKGEIEHYTYRNMVEQFAQLHSLSTIAARAEYEAGRRASLGSLFLNPFIRAFKFFILKRGYREGVVGLVVAGVEGCYTFMKYAKLWEIEFSNKLNKLDK